MKKNINCIVCPLSCELKVTIKGKNKIVRLTGYKCKKGKLYAKEEVVSPKRILTTTILTDNKLVPLLSVKTDKPVEKKYLMKIMKILNNKKINLPIKMGQVIIENILNTGSNIVATKDISRNSL